MTKTKILLLDFSISSIFVIARRRSLRGNLAKLGFRKAGLLRLRLAMTALLSAAILPLLSACSPELDLHGVDPQKYYAEHPMENKVETRHALFPLSFDHSSTEISVRDADVLQDLKNINPHAVEAINLYIGTRMSYKTRRVQHIKNLLSKYNVPIKLVTDKGIERNTAVIDITYMAVIPPDCPDWKRSPVTTYSNMPPANFGCAVTVNLGLMVDNPRDLVRGQDLRKNNTERSSKAISDYYSGTAAASTSDTASSSSSSVTGQ